MLNEKNIKSYVNVLYFIVILYIILILNGERKIYFLID